jgi:hypothetical protein
MKSSSLIFLYGVLSAILILGGLSYFGFIPNLLLEYPTTVNVISSVPSPDGVFVATTNRATNNHGWCEERTNVYRKGELFDWEREYIFNIDCGSQVEIKWEDNRNLVITYSYNAASVARTSRQFLNKDKEVSISYTLKQ